ncbi:hypothetical protein ACFS5J_00135 [Flavobacterium chuncheonense]|uniref:Uncharacterized protein n=1 Tax=Flavobacterium chuncheonense TaxID=2026653 RepID=A0ABW5YIW6_9FLAO
MDLSSALMGLVFIMLTILPIYLINRSTNKASENLINELKMEFPNSSKVLEYEVWNSNSSIIALTVNEVLFLNKKENESVNIEIQNISNCKVRKEFHKNSKHQDRDAIECLFLDFTLKERTTEISIPFFQKDAINFIIGNEVSLADKWLTKIYKVHLQ